MTNKTKCADCQGEMEKGFILDFAHGSIVQSHWQAGDPVKKTLLGLKAGVKVNKDQVKPIICFRCVKCGYLKLYAK